MIHQKKILSETPNEVKQKVKDYANNLIKKIQLMKTIYNVYVQIEDQPQADRMKQICIDYGLPYWGSDIAFIFNGQSNFCYSNSIGIDGDFALYPILYGKTQVTESEFLELVKMLNKC